jgi:enoyl-CoA hydratase/carnithine racemase
MTTYLEVDRSTVTVVLLNRPEKHNALNQQMIDELVSTLRDLQNDREVKVVVLGANGRNFCAGGDLEEFYAAHVASPEENYRAVDPGMSLFQLAFQLSKPLVVASKGVCRGGGVGLAGLGHINITETKTSFALTELRLGLFPYGIFPLLAKNMGERRALELALTSREFDSTMAQQFGLVDEVVDDSLERARELAAEISKASLYSLQSGLELYNLSMSRYDQGFFKHAGVLRAVSFKTSELGERVDLFLRRNRS